jgi:hypothetical protein
MVFKSSLVTYLFGLMEHLSAAAGEAGGSVYPAALLAAPLVKVAEDYLDKKKKPEELADLYRESLLHAIETCTDNNRGLTEEDRPTVELWKEGLNVPVKGDPLWQAILEDNLPARMLSADLRDPSKCWPLLRAQLEQWTDLVEVVEVGRSGRSKWPA